jgi:hypothetical protein
MRHFVGDREIGDREIGRDLLPTGLYTIGSTDISWIHVSNWYYTVANASCDRNLRKPE